MTEAFRTVLAAARAGAAEVEARASDQSFLEATLEREIAHRLPGSAPTAQGRRRFALQGFDPHPYGVDIDWRHDGVRAAVEVKVTDVIDSLFDVIKLATAIARGEFDEAYCATAATARQWARGGPFREMTEATPGEWRACRVDRLLVEAAAREAVLVATGPRPFEVPAQIETMATEPIGMPKAPTHTLRMLAVRPVTGTAWVQLSRRPGWSAS
jgi:hypothetical protein